MGTTKSARLTAGAVRGRSWLGLAAWLLAAVAGPAAATDPACPAERRAELRLVTAERLAYYQEHFADIQFVTLPGRGDWVDGMTALELLLGYRPTPLDYQHPPEVTELLLQVSVERIAMLMQYRLPCATLFQRGEQAAAKRPRVCVITLDECAIARDDGQATAFMLDLPGAAQALLDPKQQIEADAYLRFTLDHEAFHCLDAALHGGMPTGHDTYWGEYWRTRNEMAADAFAVAMHLRRAGAADRFAQNLARLRGLALLGGDPQHFTYDAISQVMQTPPQQLAAMSPSELVRWAHGIGGEQLPDYPAFLRFWEAAHHAMAQLGITPEQTGNRAPDIARSPRDSALVDHMTAVSRRLHGELLAP